jgi:hypothetical protein
MDSASTYRDPDSRGAGQLDDRHRRPKTGSYTQHYYDSRGVVRLYAMSFADGVWTLTRESPDFSPLDFRQRFTGTFSEDGNVISGAWEICFNETDWGHDFDLSYRRVG